MAAGREVVVVVMVVAAVVVSVVVVAIPVVVVAFDITKVPTVFLVSCPHKLFACLL